MLVIARVLRLEGSRRDDDHRRKTEREGRHLLTFRSRPKLAATADKRNSAKNKMFHEFFLFGVSEGVIATEPLRNRAPIYHNEILQKSVPFSFRKKSFVGRPALGEMHFEFCFPANDAIVRNAGDFRRRAITPILHKGIEDDFAFWREFRDLNRPKVLPKWHFLDIFVHFHCAGAIVRGIDVEFSPGDGVVQVQHGTLEGSLASSVVAKGVLEAMAKGGVQVFGLFRLGHTASLKFFCNHR